MPLEMNTDRVNELARQVQAAKRGEAEYPSDEELRAALQFLRSDRNSTEASKQKKAERKSSLPTDLNDLF